jgi:hypothetical protein
MGILWFVVAVARPSCVGLCILLERVGRRTIMRCVRHVDPAGHLLSSKLSLLVRTILKVHKRLALRKCACEHVRRSFYH